MLKINNIAEVKMQTGFLRKIIEEIFKIYYRIKITFYKLIVKNEAASYVLHDSILPKLILQMYGAKIGENVRINRWIILHATNNDFSNLTIGNDVHVGKGVLIDLTGKVSIGNRVNIGMFARILTHQNIGDSQLRKLYPPIKGDTVIPDDVVIASNVILLFPTKLTENMLVSAGSVVKGEYDSPCVLVGNPARKSRSIGEK
jgi:acetyltransferase-like isoleucine patch superfamily enzyme